MLLQVSIFKMKDALIYVQRLFQSCKISQPLEEESYGRKSEASSGGANLYELCRQFSLAEIKAATENFNDDLMIGHGGSGKVYKGFIDKGSGVVAVKRFSKSSGQGTNEFWNEVRFLCQLRHPNLVSLIGLCTEGNEMILVYEYMHNLSLLHLVRNKFVKDGCDPLSWEQRLKICIAAARALHYLHAGVKYGVIHANLRSSKILLDENWTPKICDFGVSKLGPLSMSKKPLTRIESRIAGKYRYLAPEYVLYNQLSEKCDVYSFGAVLLEVLYAKNIYEYVSSVDEEEGRSLIGHACKCIEIGSINAITIDTYLEGKIAPESLQKFLEIACECLREEGSDRPSIGEVEVTLELALELQEKAQLHSHSHSR